MANKETPDRLPDPVEFEAGNIGFSNDPSLCPFCGKQLIHANAVCVFCKGEK